MTTTKKRYPKDILGLLHPTKTIDLASVTKQFGMSQTTAYRRLCALGILPKTHRIIPKEELERLYLSEKKSLREIATLFKCDRDLIKNRLQLYNIPIRNQKEATGLVANQLGSRGDKHSNWRGGKSSLPYSPKKRSAHFWIKSHYGKPIQCEFNPNHLTYDWANISGRYLKERSDWLRLCRSCHYWFDLPDLPAKKQESLSPDHLYAYIQGRERRNGLDNSNNSTK